MFVYNPNMMMIDVTDVAVTAKEFAMPAWHVIATVAATSIVGVLALSAAVEGYFKAVMPLWARVVTAIGAFCLIVPETITDLIGLGIVIVMMIININMAKKQALPS